MKRHLLMVMLAGQAVLAGCDNTQVAAARTDGKEAAIEKPLNIERWYSQAQLQRGGALFQAHCASCHMPDASGTPNWKEPNAEGKYPPPPLNGTAHAWHHPLSVLRRTVRVGGVPLGGTMPGFADRLDSEQIDDILAWVQSHWSDKIYGIWHERNVQASRMQPLKKS
jgi:mono/diheme cytochrome c family protein